MTDFNYAEILQKIAHTLKGIEKSLDDLVEVLEEKLGKEK